MGGYMGIPSGLTKPTGLSNYLELCLQFYLYSSLAGFTLDSPNHNWLFL